MDLKQAQVANKCFGADWMAGEKVPDQAVLSKGEKQSRALVYGYEFWHENWILRLWSSLRSPYQSLLHGMLWDTSVLVSRKIAANMSRRQEKKAVLSSDKF